MSQRKVRFAFTIADGPNAGLTSGSWRVRVQKEGTYIIPASLGHMWKGSLHGDEAWRWAMTSDHVASGAAPRWPGDDRAPWKFEPTTFVNGGRLAFVIGVFRHALLPQPLDPLDIHIRVEDRWDQMTKACVWMTEPGVELLDDRLIGGPLLLSSGRQVWVTASTEAIPACEPEPLAVGSMIEPAVPGTHDVSAPGVLVRGVRLSDAA